MFLAKGLASLPGIECSPGSVETNMVFVRFTSDEVAAAWQDHLALAGIRVAGGRHMRLVTHCDIDHPAIVATLERARSFVH